jgi:hypothetical protein
VLALAIFGPSGTVVVILSLYMGYLSRQKTALEKRLFKEEDEAKS